MVCHRGFHEEGWGLEGDETGVPRALPAGGQTGSTAFSPTLDPLELQATPAAGASVLGWAGGAASVHLEGQAVRQTAGQAREATQAEELPPKANQKGTLKGARLKRSEDSEWATHP